MAIEIRVSADKAEDDLHRHVARCPLCHVPADEMTVTSENLCRVGLDLRMAFTTALLEERA